MSATEVEVLQALGSPGHTGISKESYQALLGEWAVLFEAYEAELRKTWQRMSSNGQSVNAQDPTTQMVFKRAETMVTEIWHARVRLWEREWAKILGLEELTPPHETPHRNEVRTDPGS